MESPQRSLAKAVTWRVGGTLATIGISYLITGHAGWSVAIGGTDFLVKLALYYVHERAWAHLRFGRSKDLP